ncbi:Ger(x)C family spore germination protein [Paenibacillus wynnii]|uniref:Ger(x)C family spore germination protein n=1 Tax=Paenibacillus wynnii TaxID=268407 RepID=UPI00278D10A6|nr:Ger(x)C family spore germination protein [Paenibacillus wynnii]MDQ0193158.1 spore germination protein KC [Paenibacillus wynnii]
MLRKLTLFLLSGVFLLMLTSCWDSIELNRRAIVSGMSIDKDLSKDQKYTVSFQVVVADEISGKNSRGNSPVVLYSGSGRSLYEALGNASRKVARYLSLGHVRVIIISEELAREGISDIMDFLERDSGMRLSSLLFISRGQPAKDILSIITVFGKIPSSDLVQKLETTSKGFGFNFKVETDDVIRGIEAKGAGAIINGVVVSGDQESGGSKKNVEDIEPKAILRTSGLAVFSKDKLVGFLDGAEGKGTSRLYNKLQQHDSIIELGEDNVAAFNIFMVHTTVKANAKDPEHPIINISIGQQAGLKESSGPLDLTRAEVLRDLEKRLSEQTKEETEAAVKAAMKFKSDYLGFSEAVERDNPKGWKKVQDRWNTVFTRCEVNIKVKSVIRHTDMRTRSFQSKTGNKKGGSS